jgi:hypothetical protein
MGDYSRIDVFEAIRLWLEETIDTDDFAWFTPDTVLNEPVNGPRPSGPYMTLQMIVHGERIGTGDAGRQHDFPQQIVQSVVRVQAFGQDAIDALATALDYIYHPDVLEITQTYGYVLSDDGIGLEDLTGLLETDMESRAFVDVILGCTRVGQRVITGVDTVRVDYSADDLAEGGTTQINIDMTVEE